MANKIVSIGFDLPGEVAEYCNMKSNQSLLDYDIALFFPTRHEFYDYSYESYQGKTLLSTSSSFAIRESFNRWKTEILEFLKSGKNVFYFLDTKEDIIIHTGKSETRGTGNNQKKTHLVEPYSIYQILPINISVANSTGKLMKLSKSGEILRKYMSDLEPFLEYKVCIDGDELQPLIITKNGNKTVGAQVKFKDCSGVLFLLPCIEFGYASFEVIKEDDVYWSEEALTYSKKLISAIAQINKAVKDDNKRTPAPDWTKQDGYISLKEQSIARKLLVVEDEIENMRKEKMKLSVEMDDVTSIKMLLYESGEALEKAILAALQLMGFKAEHYQDEYSEFDAVFESHEGRFLGEAEGKDNKQISIDKLRQLLTNVHEDYDKECVNQMAKGVLFGNAFRFIYPEYRGSFFTDKCLTASEQYNISLVKTTDLCKIALYLTDNNDEDYAIKCRSLIYNTCGLVEFPPIPERIQDQVTIGQESHNEL